MSRQAGKGSAASEHRMYYLCVLKPQMDEDSRNDNAPDGGKYS